jgi:hypothetical protein
VAGIATGGRTPDRVQASIYSLDVVKGYFLSRGRELRLGDPADVLERMLDYINGKLHQQGRSKGREFLTDLNLLACTEDRLCVVGTGGATVFVSHQGKAKRVMGHDAPQDLLGRGGSLKLSRLDSPVWAGDQVVFLSSPLGEVFGPREVSVILQKVTDSDKATILFNSLAARKDVEGELVTLIWEVPQVEAGDRAGRAATPLAAAPPPRPYKVDHADPDKLEAQAYAVEISETGAPADAEAAAEGEAVPASGEAAAPPPDDEATAVKKRWLRRFGRNKFDLNP